MAIYIMKYCLIPSFVASIGMNCRRFIDMIVAFVVSDAKNCHASSCSPRLFNCPIRYGLAVFALAIFSNTLLAHWPSIELESLSRLGCQVGKECEVGVESGQRLDEIGRLIFTDARIVANPIQAPTLPWIDEPSASTGQFRIAIPEDLYPGIVEARVQGRFGLSNSRRFWITRAPWSVEAWTASTPTAPLSLPRDVVKQDRCQPQQRNHYRIEIAQPTSIQLLVMSAALDSRADLDIQLRNAQGQLVPSLASTAEPSGDLHWDLAEAGDYLLTVHDRLYRGGPEYSYAMIWSQVALRAQPTALDQWKSHTENRRQASQVTARDSSDMERIPNLLSQAASQPNLTLRKPMSTENFVKHSEEDESESEPRQIPFPVVVEGCFDANDDADWFEVEFAQKTPVILEIVSERLGQVCDPFTAVYKLDVTTGSDQELKLVTKGDDMGASGEPDVMMSRDSIVSWKTDGPGKYRILVRDQQRSNRSATKPVYVFELREPKPTFDAVCYFAYPDRDPNKSKMLAPTLISGGALALAVRVHRFDGWQGEVCARVEGLPGDVFADDLILRPDQRSGHLILQAEPAVVSSLQSLRVRLTGIVDGKKVARIAKPAEFVWGPIDTRRSPTLRFTDDLQVAVESRDQLPLRVELGDGKTMQVIRGTTLKTPVKIQRSDDAQQAITVRVNDLSFLPKPIELKLDASKDLGEIEIPIPATLAAGEYSCWASVESKVNFRSNIQALERVQKRAEALKTLKPSLATDEQTKIDASIQELEGQIQKLQDATKSKAFDIQLPTNSIRIAVVENQNP